MFNFFKIDKIIDRAIYLFVGIAFGAVSYHLWVEHLIELKTFLL